MDSPLPFNLVHVILAQRRQTTDVSEPPTVHRDRTLDTWPAARCGWAGTSASSKLMCWAAEVTPKDTTGLLTDLLLLLLLLLVRSGLRVGVDTTPASLLTCTPQGHSKTTARLNVTGAEEAEEREGAAACRT